MHSFCEIHKADGLLSTLQCSHSLTTPQEMRAPTQGQLRQLSYH